MIEPLEIPGIFTRQECHIIIAQAHEATFSDGWLVGGVRADNTRRSRICWLDEDGVHAWVFQRLLSAVAKANRSHFAFKIDEFAEKPQVAWYATAPGGFFDWHIDLGEGAVASRRKLTTIVQLSESSGYGGGDLETNSDGHVRATTREIGCGLLFPSFVLHRVTPVTCGERYSLVLWAHGPAFL
ncbi:MAG: 2OG-Fe(II) oxygenase [Pseudomonadota bacterium]